MHTIDFSSKHNVMIRNEDNTLLPMDEPFFEAKELAAGTWRILSDGDYSYLVEGDREAIMIDSGYGAGNIREFCSTLTKKPLRNIVNTHDHFDHTANNCYFEKAYMSAESVPLATIPSPSFEGIVFPRDYEVEVIDEGYIFDLGGRTLEVFKIPDHAVGSIALLDSRERILFAGDEFMPGNAKGLNGTVETFRDNMQRLAGRRKDFDWICCGAEDMMPAAVLDHLLEIANLVLAGENGREMTRRRMERVQDYTPDGYPIYDRRKARLVDMHRQKATARRLEFEKDGYRLMYWENKVWN